MAVYNDTDLVQITCDGPRCTETIEAYQFEDALDQMQRNAWSYKKLPGGEWEHLCPRCKPKPVKPNLSSIFGKAS